MQWGNAWDRTTQRALSSVVVERSIPDLDAPGLQDDADGQIHIFGGQKTV